MKPILATTLTLFTILAGAGLAQTPDFIPGAAYPTGGSSAYAAVGDFNGDGLRDLVTYEATTQSLSLLFGKPDGSLAGPISRGLGFAVASLAAADFNRDGKTDLALATGAAIAVLVNAGNGSFAPASFYSAGMTANYVTTADVNHDGIVDLVVAGGGGFAVLRGLATGAFTGPLVLPQAFAHFWVGAADFNNDGNVDLVGDGSPGQFYAGNGDGTFALPVTTNTIPSRGAIGDFNADGKMDIAYLVVGFNQERVATQTISILIGAGGGQFLDAVDFIFSGPGTGQVAAGDFNGDGVDDLAIWLTSPARLFLMQYAGSRLSAIPADLTTVGDVKLLSAADIDGNGSKDLLLLSAPSVTVLRDTHGTPPLLALASISPASVVGGSRTQGTVVLGGPAPAGGAVVSLTSSNPALAFPLAATVTVPAGASSAPYSIATSAVITPTPVTITAVWNSVAQPAALTLVAPYTLTGLSINPASQYGGFTVQGTVSLSGPADSTATVLLSSSNTALASVPASVTVPAGATGGNFTITLRPVAVNTPATISASLGGVTQTSAITVLQPLDSVKITRAEDTIRSAQLRVEATSTSTSATLTVWNSATGALIGTLANAGGGKYTGSFTVSPAVLSITVRSSLGGLATGAVTQK